MLDILNTTKQRFTLDKKLLLEIKEEVLGKNFELSLVIIADKKSQSLNKKYRDQNEPADVLSFPYSKDTGEIFLNLKRAAKGAFDHKMKTIEFLYFLLIHSMLHLKGFEHGNKMEKEEQKTFAKFFTEN
jgi:rRNA maturation RNase YbeY